MNQHIQSPSRLIINNRNSLTISRLPNKRKWRNASGYKTGNTRETHNQQSKSLGELAREEIRAPWETWAELGQWLSFLRECEEAMEKLIKTKRALEDGRGQVRQHSVLGARVGVSCTVGSMSTLGGLRKVRIGSSVPAAKRRGIEGRHKGPTTHGYGDSRGRIHAFLFSSNASLTLIFDYLLRSFLKGTYCVWLPRQLVSTSGIFLHPQNTGPLSGKEVPWGYTPTPLLLLLEKEKSIPSYSSTEALSAILGSALPPLFPLFLRLAFSLPQGFTWGQPCDLKQHQDQILSRLFSMSPLDCSFFSQNQRLANFFS